MKQHFQILSEKKLSLLTGKMFALLKETKKNIEIKRSLLAGKFSCAFKRGQEKCRKKSFGGKIILGKKSLRF